MSTSIPSARVPTADGAPSNTPANAFTLELLEETPLRRAITAVYREAETTCVPRIVEQARLNPTIAEKTTKLATKLAEGLRESANGSGVEGLIQEFSLSSQEGVALMCLAKALLRIPDRATRDALIRDKISRGNRRAHLNQAPSVFVNAATWGLLITGKLVGTNSETTLASALTRLIGRGGEPLICKGVDLAMRMMGEQFVTGATIEKALSNSRKYEANGFLY